jgi:DNA-binding CsgD family transcriptional regulator
MEMSTQDWEQRMEDVSHKPHTSAREKQAFQSAMGKLTAKERFILNQHLAGKTECSIAEDLGIKQPTVCELLAAVKNRVTNLARLEMLDLTVAKAVLPPSLIPILEAWSIHLDTVRTAESLQISQSTASEKLKTIRVTLIANNQQTLAGIMGQRLKALR